MEESYKSARFWIGILLIAFGIYFLADNFYELPFHIPRLFRQWEWILIVIGVILLLTSKNNQSGIILIGIGVLFLWGMKVFWPLLLLFIGFVILRKSSGNRISATNEKDKTNQETEEDYVNETSIFGGCNKKIDIKNFRGGKITAIFGGSDLNLRDSSLADGKNYLDVIAIFGGGNLRIPKDWNVVIDAVPILGGISDKRLKTVSNVEDSNKSLIIKGAILFGGIEITN